MTELDTIKLARDVNVARFGDGEIRVALGGPCKSQAADPRLAKMFVQMLRGDGSSECLICIPRWSRDMVNELRWRTKVMPLFERLCSPKVSYGSAFISRPDVCPWIDTPDYWERVLDLWRGQDVVLLRGDGSRSIMVDSLHLAKSVEEIEAPLYSAFVQYDKLFDRLKTESRTVLMCLGSTASALAFTLAAEGVRAIDLGHVGKFIRRHQFGTGADGKANA